jgi:hypothetical protein
MTGRRLAREAETDYWAKFSKETVAGAGHTGAKIGCTVRRLTQVVLRMLRHAHPQPRLKQQLLTYRD